MTDDPEFPPERRGKIEADNALLPDGRPVVVVTIEREEGGLTIRLMPETAYRLGQSLCGSAYYANAEAAMARQLARQGKDGDAIDRAIREYRVFLDEIEAEGRPK